MEAQVTKIKDGKIFVHYNGWGNNWDECITLGSLRIAPFRTYTLQYSSSRYLSPAPNIPTDAENHEIPATTQPNFSTVFQQISQLVGWLENSLSTFSNDLPMVNKREIASQLAPLLDRTGRILIDFEPHLANIADPEECKDQEVLESIIYQNDKNKDEYDGNVPLIANFGDVSTMSNLMDRVMFSDSPSLEVHIHSLLNNSVPENSNESDQMPSSTMVSQEQYQVPTTELVDTEMQTESPSICDYAMMTDNSMTHTSLGIQTMAENLHVKTELQRTPRIKPHAGHTIIRESPKINKGKYVGGFKISKTTLRLGPTVRKHN